MARNRIHGVLTQWGLKVPARRLRQPDGLALLEARGVPQVWRRSVAEALAVIDWLDGRLAPLERELHPLARADSRVELRNDPRHRRTPGPDDRNRDRRHRPLRLSAQAGRLCRPGPEGQTVRAELAHRAAVQGRLKDAALGRSRGRSARLARDQPVA